MFDEVFDVVCVGDGSYGLLEVGDLVDCGYELFWFYCEFDFGVF